MAPQGDGRALPTSGSINQSARTCRAVLLVGASGLGSVVRDHSSTLRLEGKKTARNHSRPCSLVGASGLEPPTPTVSRWCSTPELRASRVLDCSGTGAVVHAGWQGHGEDAAAQASGPSADLCGAAVAALAEAAGFIHDADVDAGGRLGPPSHGIRHQNWKPALMSRLLSCVSRSSGLRGRPRIRLRSAPYSTFRGKPSLKMSPMPGVVRQCGKGGPWSRTL